MSLKQVKIVPPGFVDFVDVVSTGLRLNLVSVKLYIDHDWLRSVLMVWALLAFWHVRIDRIFFIRLFMFDEAGKGGLLLLFFGFFHLIFLLKFYQMSRFIL